MRGESVYKVPDGKLLKIELDFDPDKKVVNTVKITGDFFVYPEDSLFVLENNLLGQALDEEKLAAQIETLKEMNEMQFVGFSVLDLAKAIMQAAQGDR